MLYKGILHRFFLIPNNHENLGRPPPADYAQLSIWQQVASRIAVGSYKEPPRTRSVPPPPPINPTALGNVTKFDIFFTKIHFAADTIVRRLHLCDKYVGI